MPSLAPPKTIEKDFKEVVHGTTVHDPYRWLEGENKKVADWIKKQNEFSRSWLSKLPLRKKFAKRFGELFWIDTVGVPYPKCGWYFSMERKANQDLAVLHVRKGIRGKKRTLIDPNKLSKGKTTTLRQWSVSEDGRLLAYALSESGNDRNAIYVLDVATGKKLKDHIPAESYPAMYSEIAWNPNGEGFWYSRREGRAPKGEEKLHQKVFYHKLGDDFRKDAMVFGAAVAKDEFPGVMVSDDGRYLLISVLITSGRVRREDLYLRDLTDPKGKFVSIVKGVDAQFSASMHRGELFIATNHKAKNWKLMKVALRDAGRGMPHWKTVVPEGKYPIDYSHAVKDRLFVRFLENAHSVLRMYDLNGKFITTVPLSIGTIGELNAEPEGEEVFFRFTSFLIPSRVYRLEISTGKIKLFDELVIKKLDVRNLTMNQVWFHSKDGTRVPMFLVHRKGIRRDGKNPTLLYAYGGFGISETPDFSSLDTAFVERGGIYAVANIRGGGEFGEAWHEASTKNKKQTGFNDFIAAAEWLIKNKYTDSNHLAAFGWSNGGLLMGAMITQRPDLFEAIAVGAPVGDMLRFHKFHAGRYWIPEYGNPDDPKMFRYLLRYSPYHNVKDETEYPATIVITAEGDDRVHPMHAYKLAARLQKANKSMNPIILTIEKKAGHAGGASVSRVVEQYADIYGFLGSEIGMK